MIFGTESSSSTEESRVMSEKVQQMASSIYKEFERMIQQFGEDSVKDLMPLVVCMLEALDLSQLEKEEHEVELELLKEDNEQLVTQYEREKAQRKLVEQRCMELEDIFDDEKKELRDKMESLESIVRMLELKGKNSADHVCRLEEREVELKQEYSKLHDRYTELFRTHVDYMERTKFLMGGDKFDVCSSYISNQPSKGFSIPRFNRFNRDDRFDSRDFTETADILEGENGRDNSYDRAMVTEVDFGAVEEMPDVPVPRENEPQATPASCDTAADSCEDGLTVDLTGGLVDPAEFASAGMGREVENLIKENTELMETKNALNIVKNDLIAQLDGLVSEQDILREEIRSLEMIRAKMTERICDLEAELKEAKHSLEQHKDEGADVPMAHRKRFTRIEMARVLMERNQYKEKLMELQEAVKWTEMIRASRTDPSLKRKRGSIWDFFSGLFSSGNPAPGSGHSVVQLRYNAPNKQVTPGSGRVIPCSSGKLKAFDFLEGDYSSERRAAERKEQYKLVKAHVKRDESGRLQAYGWSIPALEVPMPSVPVPVYCQPLLEDEPTLKIWCAAGVDLRGGFTEDGGFIVGSSVFYSKEKLQENLLSIPGSSSSELEKLDHELQVKHTELKEQANHEWMQSNLVWICSSAHGRSLVSVIHANKPGEIIDTFTLSSSHVLCMCSVKGTELKDYLFTELFNKSIVRDGAPLADGEETVMVGAIRWVNLKLSDDGKTYCAADRPSEKKVEDSDLPTDGTPRVESSEKASEILMSNFCEEDHGITVARKQDVSVSGAQCPGSVDANDEAYRRRLLTHLPEHIKDGLQKFADYMSFATILPTMWMGSQSGHLYIHSAVLEWRKCLFAVQLEDAVLGIVQYKSRVFAALANGTIAIFCRKKNGEWCMDGYYVLTVGQPSCSVRCLVVVGDRLWCGYRNKIFVLNPQSLELEHSFDAHPRKESQVRQLSCLGDGVWCSIRLDSSLRLFHGKTFGHLQDVDIEPYVSKMLGTSKLGFSFVRITSLLLSCKRLWVGTSNGVIVSIPLTESCRKVSTNGKDGDSGRGAPGEAVRIYTDATGASDQVSPGTFTPYCDMVLAQLSFHGHRDAVKFIVSVPASEASDRMSAVEKCSDDCGNTMVVVSGGEGYVDFRVGDDDETEVGRAVMHRREWSHLIVWEVKYDM
uniref:RH1 domain-containing protein n=1 Tax=Trichuris muris TaxID=70415 RepID=A0A5S6QI53_TRIMR